MPKIDIDTLLDRCIDEETLGPKNSKAVRKCYEEIWKREDEVEGDYWREIFYDSPEWIIEIVASVKELTIHDAYLVKSLPLFEKLIKRDDINMDDYEAVLEVLEEEVETPYDHTALYGPRSKEPMIRRLNPEDPIKEEERARIAQRKIDLIHEKVNQ